MSDPQETQDMAMVKKHAEELGEHFDSVQIFVTRHESGSLDGTVVVHLGVGNWYARYGHVHEWVIQQDEYSRMKSRENP